MSILILSIAISGCTDNESSSVAGTSADGSFSDAADAKTELKNIFSKKDNLEHIVSYTRKITGLEDVVMTQYTKEGNIRIDNVVGGLESRAYIKGLEMYACSKVPEGWLCFGFETPEDIDYQHMDYLDEDHEAYNVMYLEKRTIAGASAQCYKMEGTQDNSYFEYCYSSDNIPLYIKIVSSEQGTTVTEMIATSYSTSVSDSDFELPAEPMKMNSMMK